MTLKFEISFEIEFAIQENIDEGLDFFAAHLIPPSAVAARGAVAIARGHGPTET